VGRLLLVYKHALRIVQVTRLLNELRVSERRLICLALACRTSSQASVTATGRVYTKEKRGEPLADAILERFRRMISSHVEGR
jgi:hypothetical protein